MLKWNVALLIGLLALVLSGTGTSAGAPPPSVFIGLGMAVQYGSPREQVSHVRVLMEQINDRSDGYYDDILVGYDLQFGTINTGCSSSVAVSAGLDFAGIDTSVSPKVSGIVGATCSGAAMGMQELVKIWDVPMVSYSATSPSLSDAILYPTFFRTIISDVAQAGALVDLAVAFGATRMGILYGDDSYGSGLAEEFRGVAPGKNVTVPAVASKEFQAHELIVEATAGYDDYSKGDLSMICKMRDIHNLGIRHVAMTMNAQDAHYIATTAIQSGYLFGPDFQYYAVDGWSSNNFNIFTASDNVWWGNFTGSIGGYYASSLGGDPYPLMHLPDGDGEELIMSISYQANCAEVSGTLVGSTVTLNGVVGTLFSESMTISWSTGEIWTRLPIPTIDELRLAFAGTLGLDPDTRGPLLADYITNIWEPMNADYAYVDYSASYLAPYSGLESIGESYFTSGGSIMGWHDADGNRNTLHTYGSTAYDAALALVLAIDKVIKDAGDYTDGTLVTEALKTVDFEGLSGRVKFNSNGDREGLNFKVLNMGGYTVTEVGSLEFAGVSNVTLSITPYYAGGGSAAPHDGTCTKNAIITEYCSGNGICNFGPATCSCNPGWAGANCEIAITPPCSSRDWVFSVSACTTENERTGTYRWLATDANGNPTTCCNEANFPGLCPSGAYLPGTLNVECDYIEVDSTIAQTFIALAAIFVAALGLSALGLAVKSRHPAIKRSQPLLLYLATLGAQIGIASIFVYPGEHDELKCRLMPTLLSLGFVLMYASLIMKMWRIDRIFNNTSLRKLHLGTGTMLARVGILVILDIILLMVYIFVDDLSAGYVTEEVGTQAVPFYQCTIENKTIGTLMIIYKIAMLLYGVYMAYKVRNAPGDFQEVKFLGFGIYNTAIAGVVVVPIFLLLDSLDREVLFILYSVGVIYAFSTCMLTVNIPKIIHSLYPHDPKKDPGTMGTQGLTTGGMSGTVKTGNLTGASFDKESVASKERITVLEGEVESKDQRIRDLEKALAEAQK